MQSWLGCFFFLEIWLGLNHIWLSQLLPSLSIKRTTCCKRGGVQYMKLANHGSGVLLWFLHEVTPLEMECFWQRVKIRKVNYTNIGPFWYKKLSKLTARNLKQYFMIPFNFKATSRFVYFCVFWVTADSSICTCFASVKQSTILAEYCSLSPNLHTLTDIDGECGKETEAIRLIRTQCTISMILKLWKNSHLF